MSGKKCNRCKMDRAAQEFVGKNERVLKTCKKCRDTGIRSRQKNKEYYTEYNKRWKEENKGRIKEYNKSYKKGEDWDQVKQDKLIVDKKPSPKRKEHIFIDGIEHKTCSKCKIDRILSQYTNYSKSWDGLRTTCNVCLQEYRDSTKGRMSEYNKDYWVKTKDAQTKKHKEWTEQNKEHISTWRKRYIPAWEKKQRESNPQYKMTKNLRTRLWSALNNQGAEKSFHTFDLVGCSPAFLKGYLEGKFLEGMTWDNYGPDGWHVDHIRPCISYDLTDPEQQKECFHYTNLQPLWASDNTSKGGKWIQIVYELNFVETATDDQ